VLMLINRAYLPIRAPSFHGLLSPSHVGMDGQSASLPWPRAHCGSDYKLQLSRFVICNRTIMVFKYSICTAIFNMEE